MNRPRRTASRMLSSIRVANLESGRVENMFGSLGYPELGLVALMMVGSLVVVAWPASRICERVGLPRWLGLLAVVPLCNIGLLWYVAVSRWPREADVSGTRA